jgi:hypothetical protein
MNILQKTQFNLASKSDAQKFISDAKEWYNYGRGNEGFESGGVVVRALAEYMANQEQKTIYTSKSNLV